MILMKGIKSSSRSRNKKYTWL